MNDHIAHVVAQPFDFLQPFVVFLQLLEEIVLAVTTALLFETGTDPRFQQGGIERLREIVFRVGLDATHH